MTAAEAAEPFVVTTVGVYEIPNHVYHADPTPDGSLSCSGAKTLLEPGCPALFKWQLEHGRPDRRTFDFGHAAHDKILGGPEIVVVDADSWRTSAAKAEAAEARERGAVPLLRDEYAVVEEMAAALLRHPTAAKLLSPDNGTAEASLFWTDAPSGVTRRARLDLLPHAASGRMIVPDYKTAVSAHPDKFARAAMDLRYHMQGPYYCDGVRALGLADDPVFVFVVQEKAAPYLVSVVQLDATADRIGALLNRRAIDLYAKCKADDRWPSYTETVTQVALPAYYERQFEEELS